MPLRSDWSSTTCPIAHAADTLSDAWVLLILRELFSGRGSFDDIKNATGISDSVLARRLRTMVDSDLVIKANHGYELTASGEQTLPILHAYSRFAALADPSGQWGLTVLCSTCGSTPPSSDWCPTCQHALTAHNTLWQRTSFGASPFHLISGAPA